MSRNSFKVITDVVRHNRPFALYKECSSLVAGTIANDAIRFMTYDRIKAAFADNEIGHIAPARWLLAGMCTGVVVSTCAVTPTESIKTAMIDDARSPGPQKFRGGFHALTTLMTERGIRGLYRGYPTTTLKQMGTTSFRLGSYHILKDYESSRGIKQTTLVNFAFDAIKTRAQSAEVAGTAQALKSVLANYGIRGLWKSTAMRLGRAVLAGGILFTAYENTVKIINPPVPHVG